MATLDALLLTAVMFCFYMIYVTRKTGELICRYIDKIHDHNARCIDRRDYDKMLAYDLIPSFNIVLWSFADRDLFKKLDGKLYKKVNQ